MGGEKEGGEGHTHVEQQEQSVCDGESEGQKEMNQAKQKDKSMSETVGVRRGGREGGKK